MNKIFLLCVLSWAALGMYAQNTVRGKITNENHEPLPGASIYVSDVNKGTVTDKNGFYEMTQLPNGKIRLQISFLGYANQVKTLDLKNETATLDVTLLETAVEAEEIVVSGGYNATQHENSVKIDVLKLNGEEHKITPNFMEAITRIPGVDMISKGSGVSKPVIRGLSMNDVLTLSNGVRFENYQYSSHHPLGIDEFGIANVEIIKGPASLLYGSDAIGGVINFIKEKPAPMGVIQGDYNMQLFSNSLGMNNNLGLKGASEKFFGGIRVGQKTNADYLQGGGDFVPNSRFNEVSIKTNGGFTDKLGTFNLFYDYNRQKLGLVEDEAIDEILKRGRKNEIFFQQLNTHLLSSQNKLYLNRFRLDLNAAYQNTQLSHIGHKDEYEIQMRLATLTYEAKMHLPSGRNSDHIVGFQGLHQANTNVNNREEKILPDAVIRNYSLFGLVQRQFFDKLKLQGGLRYDFKTIDTQPIGDVSEENEYRAALSKKYDSFSGSAGMVFNFTADLLLRANFAAAYRTPNLAELTSKGQHEAIYEVGDASLKPEKAYQTDASVHYHRNNITFDIAVFYNTVNSFIFISPTGAKTESGIPVYQYKQADAFLYGLEAGLHAHPKQMEWLHFRTTFSSVIGKQRNGVYLPFIPAHKINTELRAEAKKRMFLHHAFVSVSMANAFEQSKTAPDETVTPGYTLIDFSVGGDLPVAGKMMSLNVGVNNLFDKKYVDHLSTLKEVSLFNPGRNVTFSLRIPF